MSELERATTLGVITGSRSFLFYGPGGSGKTSLAVKHPGKKKIYADIDERLHELQLTKEERDAITVWRPDVTLGNPQIQIVSIDPTRKNVYAGTQITEEPKGYKRTVTFLNELITLSYECRKKNDPFPFDCAIIDSLTRLVDHCIYAVMYQHKATNMTQTLYGVEGRNLKELIFGFLLLPCDKILIAHSVHNEKRDEESGAIIWERIRPNVQGSNALREELQTYFSEVYHFLGRKPNGKYLIQTATDRLAPARTTRALTFEQEIDPKIIFA